MAENKDNNITSVMEALVKGAESVFTTKTVVGEATKIDDTIIIPLVDVSFGIGAGASCGAGKDSRKNGGMGGMNQANMMKQAQKMQQDMAKKQAELEEMVFTASAGGGAVTATVKQKQLVTLEIKPEVIDPEDAEMLSDLVMAAVNEAMKQSDETYSTEMNKLTGGMAGIL